MNLDKVFEQLAQSENPNVKIINYYEDSPSMVIGMFNKLIINHLNFNQKVKDFFEGQELEFDPNDIKSASEFVVFHRAWFYLSKLQLGRKRDEEALAIAANDDFKLTLRLAIKFFESIEDYEKCAFVLRVLEKIELLMAEDVPS